MKIIKKYIDESGKQVIILPCIEPKYKSKNRFKIGKFYKSIKHIK